MTTPFPGASPQSNTLLRFRRVDQRTDSQLPTTAHDARRTADSNADRDDEAQLSYAERVVKALIDEYLRPAHFDFF